MTENSITPQPSRIKRLMAKHPLFSFIFLAYSLSWVISIPFILSEWGILKGDMRLVFAIKSFGPFIAAVVMTRILEGSEGIKRLRQSIRQTRAGWGLYLSVLLGIPALLIIGIVIQPGTLQGFQGVKPLLAVTYFFAFILVFFGGGPLGEEPGWRGFALPRLQSGFGPLAGTLLLGVVWTCWHLPDFLTSAQGGGPGTGFSTFLINFSEFLVLVESLSILFTWIYNRTKGSLFFVLLAHTSVNTPQVVLTPLFPALDTTKLNLAALIGFGLSALMVLILTRGKLGYRIEQSVD
jgi:uncharacterized protein